MKDRRSRNPRPTAENAGAAAAASAKGPLRRYNPSRTKGQFGSKLQRFADFNRDNLTSSEWQFEKTLLRIGEGRLKGRFLTQHAISGKWILDFFIPEVRLGIEIDGHSHTKEQQQELDRKKAKHALAANITLIRFSNDEVWRDEEALVERLREGWHLAKKRLKEVYERDRATAEERRQLLAQAKPRR